MLVKITSALIILLINSGIANAQFFESVEKETERILISLSGGDSLKSSELTELKNLLTTYVEKNSSESNLDVNQRSIDSLTNHFTEFESESQNISTDSAFVLFNDWYLHFQNIFYEYSKEKFFSSPKQKILFFSTSMSCYCTLKMTREQTVELLKYVAGNNDKYDYWIIDSYWYNELQIEYETLFAPAVIVFNGSNEVLYKIEYEEKMIAQLTDYFNNNSN
ncbi:MAG: hypothetical protein H6Q27_953 [Ignavibacteriaceae bacterium]|nr:hypothetical protein [Ignavibacteriaceae bacterium]